VAPPATAQEDVTLRQSYTKAEEDYKIGRLDQCIDQLQTHLGSYRGTLLQNAYRMLSLCYLAKDDLAQTEYYANLLLQENPYYTSVSDPARFEQVVSHLKEGRGLTITTASNQAENLNEVPVPTTLISEEMIRNSGARNLQEVLEAYVPGMHVVDCNNDINIAMRGIFSNSQEKILIMINGHRMNSYCTNIASPDFSLSLEKIKQIEVLRGPASSLYGGVALTAVVNLITKQGVDIDGIIAKASAGNHGQVRGDLIFGKHYFDLDLLTWGSIYRADGETGHVPPEQDTDGIAPNAVTVGMVGSKPSYDFGIQFRWRDLQLFYNTHYSQIVQPLTISTLARPYFHDRYRTFNGVSPSFATQSHHANLSYQKLIGNLNLKASLTYDNSDLTHYEVISEAEVPGFINLFNSFDDIVVDSTFRTNGLSRYINGQEQTYGGQIKGDFKYVNTARHKGSFTFGAEYSHFQLDDVRYVIGYNHTKTLSESNKIKTIGQGHENSYNAFAQLKHQWGPLIFNAGLRFDHKVRAEKNINEFSPRAALIFLQPKWDLKFSYSKAFVDAPYLYRKTNLFLSQSLSDDSFADSGLESESLHSLQLTFSGHEWVKGLNIELNAFYNHAKDMIVTHIVEYTNEGSSKTIGVELMASYRQRRFTANFNLSYLNTLKMQLLSTDLSDNNNTPKIMSHLVLGWHPTDRLRLFSHIAFTGRQTTHNTNVVELITIQQLATEIFKRQMAGQNADELIELYEKSANNIIYVKDIDARAIVNIGAEYTLGRLTFGANIHNLFNTSSYLSGMNTRLVPQQTRWWTLSVGYKF